MGIQIDRDQTTTNYDVLSKNLEYELLSTCKAHQHGQVTKGLKKLKHCHCMICEILEIQDQNYELKCATTSYSIVKSTRYFRLYVTLC